MIQEYLLRVMPRVAAHEEDIIRHIATSHSIDEKRIIGIHVAKRSIDARQRQVMVNLKVIAGIDEPLSPNLVTPPRINYQAVQGNRSAIVVGAGPAGLFAALRLIEHGVKPIVLERGKDVVSRRNDVAKISRKGIIDPDSNYCFGEGGAGAYSDGKLYTRSKKRGSIERILSIFVQHGASGNILVDAHPHIGSDKLPHVIQAMRETIISCGGEVHFETRVTDLSIANNAVTGVLCANGEQYHGPVILATGHSARDVYRMLAHHEIEMQPKGIAMGVRLEHPQHLIDQIQYHHAAGRGEWLPAAEYSFLARIDDRAVYSFCMCPGGVVVPAASAPGQLVVNGMSPSHRNTYWANSGMVVELFPEDIPSEFDRFGVLKVMEYQEYLEHLCFEQAGKSQVAGAQRMLDFVEGRASKLIPPASYPAGLQASRIDQWLPAFIRYRLQKGFRQFGRMAKGFLTNDAIVIGVETRTSSPVRIPRDNESLQHVVLFGLYPCGEGAGYAGGIVSAAIDGERCADQLAQTLS
ncbi:MAG: FAD-binding protein [Muribaculaceae bacterium]|nr:FAD-binding protein [Muribaculaceae bacterium]